MSQYNWTTCPSAIRGQIDTLLTHLATLLGANQVGVYLHGSLAMGCFNPDRSDIDLLVVTHQGMPVETKRDIIVLFLHNSLAPCPIEISFLVEQQMHPFRHPLPYNLHYSENHRERYTRELADGTWQAWNDATSYDYDLAAHLTIIRARGICLTGKPIQEVFPVVPPAAYADAIIRDFDDAFMEREHMAVYFTLNACRVLAFLREGHIYSKDEGGTWGLSALPQEQRSIVAWALDMYRGNRVAESYDSAMLASFADYMKQEIDLDYYTPAFFRL
jgi:predicted nucleotidyltransferase